MVNPEKPPVDLGYNTSVPTANVATNNYTSEVIGNKTDNGVTVVDTDKSIMAYTKGTLGLQAVQTADAVTNVVMRDVVGNKSDTVAGTSLVAIGKQIKAKTDNLPDDPADESALEALLAAATPNTEAAANLNDTVGNKTDNAVTASAANKSAMAYIKGLVDLNGVPVEDAATDTNLRDVVGKKSDTVAGTSIVASNKRLEALHAVPTEDAATDTNMRDVVGKKSDTAAGSSIVALVKNVDNNFDVPTEDSADDNMMRDVIGKKSDTVAGTSLVSLVKIADAAVDVIDGYHDVPVEDAATDATIRDVVGKKSDTVAGSSLVSLVKVADAAIDVIDGLHDVPTEDAATDSTIRDVVGKKSDTTAGTSIVAIGKQIKAQTDKINNQSVDAGDVTHAITVAHDVNETQVLEVAKAGIYSLTLLFDLDVLVTASEGTTVTVRAYNKIDGTNYSDKAFDKKLFTIASSTEYPFMEYRMLHGYTKVTVQLGSAVTETRTIAYRSITSDLGA
ncbi:MAG: hypothetical protein WC365_09070 [Candidatus Babeliales bacterium]|jgi:hypothetical protein